MYVDHHVPFQNDGKILQVVLEEGLKLDLANYLACLPFRPSSTNVT